MEGYSRDLLCAVGRGDGFLEQRPHVPLLEVEEVELSLGLSLGGRFGLEPRGEKLGRSSSVASILTEKVAVAPRALARTSSLPIETEEEVKKRQLEWRGSAEAVAYGLEGSHVNGAVAQPVVTSQGSRSRSPSSGSSEGEGQKLEVSIVDALMRTSSLPAGIVDEWRKRKEQQSLKRLEVKRKRLERRNSLTSNVAKEALGQKLEEISAGTEEAESCNNAVRGSDLIRDVNLSDVQHHADGLLPASQAVLKSHSGMPKMQNSPSGGKEHYLSPAVSLPAKGTKGAAVAPPPALAARMLASCAKGVQNLSRRVAARAKSMGDVEKIMMQEMPCVSTRGLGPNGKTIEGFLYKYRKGEEVRIVCVCHGSFLTPAEFVKHAGGGDVAHPLRHIVVNPVPSFF